MSHQEYNADDDERRADAEEAHNCAEDLEKKGGKKSFVGKANKTSEDQNFATELFKDDRRNNCHQYEIASHESFS